MSDNDTEIQTPILKQKRGKSKKLIDPEPKPTESNIETIMDNKPIDKLLNPTCDILLSCC